MCYEFERQSLNFEDFKWRNLHCNDFLFKQAEKQEITLSYTLFTWNWAWLLENPYFLAIFSLSILIKKSKWESIQPMEVFSMQHYTALWKFDNPNYQ